MPASIREIPMTIIPSNCCINCTGDDDVGGTVIFEATANRLREHGDRGGTTRAKPRVGP